MFKYLILIVFLFMLACRSNNPVPDNSDEKEKEKTIFNEKLIKINRYLVKEDKERIESYIERHQWNMTMSSTGLFYEITQKGTGDSIKTNDIITLNYEIELLDGTKCYSSDSLGAKEFKVGQGGVEAGLEEGVLLLKVGSKARFIMPPYMAHNLLGDMNKIPPRSIIVYKIEIIAKK